MCLIAFAIGCEPRCPLLLAANRDEFFDRPTQALHRWALPNGVVAVAGRDAREGGAWLGVSEHGRMAMLTNVRSPAPTPVPASRGHLVARWLQGEVDWEQLLASTDPAAYAGFNLVVGDAKSHQWGWVSNRPPHDPHGETAELHSRLLLPGVYVLSNASLDTPWPKALRLKQALTAALPAAAGNNGWRAPLQAALADRSPFDDTKLPHTGIALTLERALSSAFVELPGRGEQGYGTRSSLLLRATLTASVAGTDRTAWRVDMDEWTHAGQRSAPLWAPESRRSESLVWAL